MYLKNIIIRNSGPLEKIDIEMPFNQDGTPKPVIFVGENGSGKTILLSSIVDALFEIGNKCYNDVLPKGSGLDWKYYKIVSGLNKSYNSVYGFSFLKFVNSDVQYIEKAGTISFHECKTATNDMLNLPGEWVDDGNIKDISIKECDITIKNDFKQNSYCFFPTNRHEIPHWLNTPFIKDSSHSIGSNITTELGKPIICESNINNIIEWAKMLITDCRSDVYQANHEDVEKGIQYYVPQAASALLYKQGKNLIDGIISLILCKNVRFNINNRRYDPTYLNIIDKNSKVIIPSLKHLSFGQATLLSIFCTVIMYSDLADSKKICNPSNFKGIVLIDEIDAHLHSIHQLEVLPKLIKMFPGVQFIVTTHSPLFLLGMRQEYGREDGFDVYELPKGESISVEDFSEFGKAFDSFTQTSQYKRELDQAIADSQKPLLFVEGALDIKYIEKASELLECNGLTKKLTIMDGGGFGGLDKTNQHFEPKLSFITPQKIILLYDCDKKKPSNNKGNIYIRNIQQMENKIKKGIENLFPNSTIDKIIDYDNSMIEIEYGHKKVVNGQETDVEDAYTINNDKKKRMCDWICENGTKEDFVNFESIFKTIKEIIESGEATSSPAQ